MKNLNKYVKGLLIILTFITFNVIADWVIFEKAAFAQHVVTGVIGGIGSGFAFIFITKSYLKKKIQMQSGSKSSR